MMILIIDEGMHTKPTKLHTKNKVQARTYEYKVNLIYNFDERTAR